VFIEAEAPILAKGLLYKKRSEYRKVILPLTVLRRFDCIFAPTKDKVLAEHGKVESKGDTSTGVT